VSISKKSTIPSSLIPDGSVLTGSLESEDLSFRQAIRTVRKRKHIVFLMALIIGVLTFIISLVLRPYYSSVAAIEIEKQQNDMMGSALGQLASSLGGGDDVKTEIQTEVTVLQSDALGIETIERTHFEDHQSKYWRVFGGGQRVPSERGLPLSEAPITRERLLKEFESRLTITPVLDTRLIQVAFEDPDPKFAANITNALIDQYIHDRLERRNSSTVQATGWMSGEINDLNKQVQVAEQRLIDYQRQSGLIVIPSAGGNISSQGVSGAATPTVSSPVLDRLTQLNSNLVTAESNRITQEALYRLAKSGDVEALANMAAGLQASSANGSVQGGTFNGLLALRQQQTSLKVQLSSAMQIYGLKNPHLIDLDKQLATIDQQIQEEVKRIVNTTEMNYQVALKSEDGIRKAYDAEEREAYRMNDSQIRLAVLQQEADSTRALYQDLYTKLQESKLSEGTQSSNVSIISGALDPARPLHPKKVLNTVIGLIAGLIIGVVATFVLDNLDDSIVTSIEVENSTGVPVLGSIPHFDQSPRSYGRRNQQMAPVTAPAIGAWIAKQPTSQVAEAYRALRTNLLLSQPGAPPRTLLVTSSLPTEGKSTTAYNLAACFANFGARVLALDADLRKPALHKLTNSSNERGLSNLLTSSLNPVDFIVQDPEIRNLSLLPAGPIPPNPAELLGSRTFSALLDTLSHEYDLVVIDSPPSMLVADSTIMAAMVDGVVVVLRSGVTTRPTLVRVAEGLQRNRAHLLGFVLNAVDTKSAEYYYAYGYYGTEYSKYRS